MPKRTDFLFGYPDLARLTGMTHEALQQHRTRQNFDPENLESILLFVARHGAPKLRHRLIAYSTMRLLPEKAGKRPKTKAKK